MTETSTHLQEIALEKAMAQSADEAASWHRTRLARFALAQCNALELASDELAGFSTFESENCWLPDINEGIAYAYNQCMEALQNMRMAAIDEASAGFDDEYHDDRLNTDTPTVSEALAQVRRYGNLGIEVVGDPMGRKVDG